MLNQAILEIYGLLLCLYLHQHLHLYLHLPIKRHSPCDAWATAKCYGKEFCPWPIVAGRIFNLTH